MTQDELDHAAHELLQRSTSGSSPSSHHSNGKPLYYEHLGGYAMHEMKDYNQYSRPHEQIGSTTSPQAFANESTEDGVDAVFITSIWPWISVIAFMAQIIGSRSIEELEQKPLRTNESLHREIVAFLTTVGISLEIDVECGKCSQVAPFVNHAYRKILPTSLHLDHSSVRVVGVLCTRSSWNSSMDVVTDHSGKRCLTDLMTKHASGLLHTVNICFAHSWLQPDRWLRSTTPTKTRLWTVKLQT